MSWDLNQKNNFVMEVQVTPLGFQTITAAISTDTVSWGNFRHASDFGRAVVY